MTDVHLPHLPPGDWPTWISAIASVGALVAAIVAAVVTIGLLKREAERDRVAADERRAEQANHVAAWYGGDHGIGNLFPARMTRDEVGTYLRNASKSPVYDVVIEYYCPIRNVGLSWRGLDTRCKVLPPAEKAYFVGVIDDVARNLSTFSLAELTVAVMFRDSAGRTWRRDTQGRLSEIDDPQRYGREAVPPPERGIEEQG